MGSNVLGGITTTFLSGVSFRNKARQDIAVIEVDEKIDTLVIPEGFTIEQIAARCEKQGICSAQEFLNAVYGSDDETGGDME